MDSRALGQGQALLSVTLHWNGHVRQFPHLETLSTSTNMVHVLPYVACSCGLHRFDLQELRLQPSGCFLLGNRACRYDAQQLQRASEDAVLLCAFHLAQALGAS